jgi:hypothetical protein
VLERLITGRHGNPATPERAKRHFVPSPQRIKREIKKLGLSGTNGDGNPTAAVPTDMLRTTTVYSVSAIGLDMGKNTLHMIGPRLAWRRRVAKKDIARTHRIEACEPAPLSRWHRSQFSLATHYVARGLAALGHDVKQVPSTYAKPFRRGRKNDLQDAHSVAEAVQRPTTRLVPAKTNERLDLQVEGVVVAAREAAALKTLSRGPCAPGFPFADTPRDRGARKRREHGSAFSRRECMSADRLASDLACRWTRASRRS